MTRDEAKKFLTNLSWSVGTTAMEYWGDETGRKIREAVKAFEPEPIPCRIWTDDDGKEHLELINEWRWIPVTERLPKYGQKVLMWKKFGWKFSDAERFRFNISEGVEDEHFDYFIDEWGKNRHYNDVVAWMPLPTPYEGSDSDAD